MLRSSDRRRFNQLLALGCVVCRRRGIKNQMAEIHHLVQGMRRLGHDHTIPLCAYHHRGVLAGDVSIELIQNTFGVSRHYHGKKAFELDHGTELELLQYVNSLIET